MLVFFRQCTSHAMSHMHTRAFSNGVRIRHADNLNIQDMQLTRTCVHRAFGDGNMSFHHIDALALNSEALTAQGCASRSALVSQRRGHRPKPDQPTWR